MGSISVCAASGGACPRRVNTAGASPAARSVGNLELVVAHERADLLAERLGGLVDHVAALGRGHAASSFQRLLAHLLNLLGSRLEALAVGARPAWSVPAW